jgi:hypothetical protein
LASRAPWPGRNSPYSPAPPKSRDVGWSASTDAAPIALAASQAGAFVLATGSADSALLITLAPGASTAQVSGPAGSTGVALGEVYEVR